MNFMKSTGRLLLLALLPAVSAFGQLTFDPANPPESVTPPTEQYNSYSSWQKGPKTLIVFLVQASDAPEWTNPKSFETLDAELDVMSEAFYRTSYRQTWFGPVRRSGRDVPRLRVTSVMKLSGTVEDYRNSFSLLQSHASQAARNAGYQPDDFDRWVVMSNRNMTRSTGLAFLGGKFSWTNGDLNSMVAIHEVGHNWGVVHNNSWYIPSGGDPYMHPRSPDRLSGEYGGRFCVMGGGNVSHMMNHLFRENLGFLENSRGEAPVVDSGGTHRLYNYLHNDRRREESKVRTLIIPSWRSTYGGWSTIDKRVLLGFGHRSGTDGGWGMTDYHRNAVIVQSKLSDGSNRIDTTPNSREDDDGVDSAIKIGRTYHEPADLNGNPRGVYITPVLRGSTDVNGMDHEWIDVTIHFEDEISGNQPPTADFSTNMFFAQPGVLFEITVNASDPNGDPLAFDWDFGDDSYNIVNSATQTKTWTQAGLYLVIVTVSDMKGGLDTARVWVNVGNVPFRVPENPEDTLAGLSYRYYQGIYSVLPDFNRQLPIKQGTVPNITLSPREQNSDYGFVFEGFVQVLEEDVYTFALRSDDGSRLTIGNQVLIDNDGVRASARTRTGNIALQAGWHAIRVDFFQRANHQELSLTWARIGQAFTAIPDAQLRQQDLSAVPVAQVALTSPQQGAEVLVGSDVLLQADASHPDGIERVIFFVNGTYVGESEDTPYAYLWEKVSVGSVTLVALAIDSNGVAVASAPVQIEVTSPPPTRVVSINFVGSDATSGGQVLGAGERVGAVYAEPYWNNLGLTYDAGRNENLLDNRGLVTGVNASQNSNNGTTSNASDESAPGRMFRGLVRNGASGDPLYAQATGIPYTEYDVYVYFDFENDNLADTYVRRFYITDLARETELAPAKFGHNASTHEDSFGDYPAYEAWVGYKESTALANDVPLGERLGNYVVFRGLTAPEFRINVGNFEGADSGTRFFNGMQIVEVSPSQPQIRLLPPVTGWSVKEGDPGIVYAVSLTLEPDSAVTVEANAGDPLWISTTTLSFDASNWHQPQPVVLRAVDGSPNPAALTHSVSASGNYNGITVAPLSVAVESTPGSHPAPGANQAPVFTSGDLPGAIAGEIYSFTLTATDGDGDPLAFTMLEGPGWLTLTDNGNGSAGLSGTPPATRLDSERVIIAVSDGVDAALQIHDLVYLRPADVTWLRPVNGAVELADLNVDLHLIPDIDGHGNPVDTVWSVTEAPVGGEALFTDTNAASTRVSFTEPGRYTLRLDTDNGQVPGYSLVEVFAGVSGGTVLTNGLAGYWRMNETGGTTLADSSGNNRNATVTDGGTLTVGASGIDGRAISIASGQSASYADASIPASGKITFSVWFTANFSPPTGDRHLLRLMDGTSYRAQVFLPQNESRLMFEVSVGGKWRIEEDIVASQWQHLVISHDGSDTGNHPRFWLNGREVDATRTQAPTQAWNGGNVLRIGGNGSDWRSWPGTIDELRYYTRAFSPEDVALLGTFGDLNTAPRLELENVGAGPEVTVPLSATVTDDGQPDPPGDVDLLWTIDDGPGGGMFTADSVADSEFTTGVRSGVYTLRLQADDGGALVSGTMLVVSENGDPRPPVIQNHPQSQSAGIGGSATFSVTFDAEPYPDFEWRFNGTPIAGAPNEPVFTIDPVAAEDDGSYDVILSNTVSNELHSVTSEVAVLTVVLPPQITAHPQSLTRELGQSAGFSVTATGEGELQYQWCHNDNPLSGATNSTLDLTDLTYADAGSYHVLVSNTGGETPSDPALLTVEGPPEIVAQPSAQQVPVGGEAVFSVSAAGTTPLHYQWYGPSGMIANATNAAFTIAVTQAADEGDYYVVVSNAIGNVQSDNAALTLIFPPAAPGAPAVQTVSRSRIDLSWAELAADADSFRLETGASAFGPWNELYSGSATSAVHEALEPATEYFYRLFAVNAAGDSEPSVVVSAFTYNVLRKTHLINFGDTVYTSDGTRTWQSFRLRQTVGVNSAFLAHSNVALKDTDGDEHGPVISLSSDITGDLVGQNIPADSVFTANPFNWFSPSVSAQREVPAFNQENSSITYSFSGFSAQDDVIFEMVIRRDSTGRNITLVYNPGESDEKTLLANADSGVTRYLTNTVSGATNYSFRLTSNADTWVGTINAMAVHTEREIATELETPTVTAWPTATNELTYGQTLAAVGLSGGTVTNAQGDAVEGGFAFVDPSFQPPVGTNDYAVRFTPADTMTYRTVDGLVEVVVNPAGEPIVMTVTFDANEGTTPEPQSKQVTYGQTYGTLAITMRSNYNFTGWFTAAEGGSEVTASTTVTVTNDHTLHAQWSGIQDEQAVVIFEDGFEAYAAGDLHGKGGWTGPTGDNAFKVETDGGLTNSNPQIPGGGKRIEAVSASGNQSANTYNSFESQSGTVWVRCNIRVDANNRFFSLRLENGAPDFKSALGISINNNRWSARATDSGGSHTTVNSSATGITANQIYTLVFKAEKSGANGDNYDKVTLWVNPSIDTTAASLTDLTGGDQIAEGNTGIASFDTLTFQRGSDGGAKVEIDEIMVVALGSVSDDASLVSVLGQSDSAPGGGNGETTGNPISWDIAVAHDVEELTVENIVVAAGAGAKLYSDDGFSANENQPITLVAETATNAYVKVTAQDGETTLYYAVTITRAGAPIVMTVTFDANEGTTPEPQSKQVTFGQPYGSLATTTRSNYNFTGWFTAAEGGSEVTASTTVTVTDDHTLLAQWEPIPEEEEWWRSDLYRAGWEVPTDVNFFTDPFLQDFSYAGYQRGEQPLPEVTGPVFDVSDPAYGADTNGVAYSTAAIQAAIDAAAAAGGGVVYLPAGTYRVAPTNGNPYALLIETNNIVLRGAGVGQTHIVNTATLMRDRSVILVRAPSGGNWRTEVGTPVTITADLTGPVRVIPVASTGGFAVGDWVVLRSDLTEALVADFNMSDLWGASDRRESLGGMLFYRQITAIDAGNNTIEVDVPTRFALLTRDNARVYHTVEMLEDVGLENFSIGNLQHSGTIGWGENDYNNASHSAYDVHLSQLITWRGARNCWMQSVHSFKPADNTKEVHMLSNGVVLHYARGLTLRDVSMERPQYGGGGGNGYMIRMSSAQETLVQDCRVAYNRHGFSFSGMQTSGNVIHRGRAEETKWSAEGVTNGDGSDHHMHLSQANLVDTVTCDGDYFEAAWRSDWGTIPHGLTATHSVFWNLEGLRYGSGSDNSLVQSEQFAYGYVIGTRGPASNVKLNTDATARTDPVDIVEGVGMGDILYPFSLYEDQLARRLDPEFDPGPLYDDATLVSVLGVTDNEPGTQTGTSGDPITWTVNVPDTVTSLAPADIVAVDFAVAQLFSDSAYTTEITGENTLALNESTPTIAYVLVTAEDQVTKLHYSVSISRVQAFAVTYNANGGGNAPVDANDYLAGETVTVLGAGAMTREAYEFTSWNTTPDGTGDAYDPGDTFEIQDDITLYAQWRYVLAQYNFGQAGPTTPPSGIFATVNAGNVQGWGSPNFDLSINADPGSGSYASTPVLSIGVPESEGTVYGAGFYLDVDIPADLDVSLSRLAFDASSGGSSGRKFKLGYVIDPAGAPTEAVENLLGEQAPQTVRYNWTHYEVELGSVPALQTLSNVTVRFVWSVSIGNQWSMDFDSITLNADLPEVDEVLVTFDANQGVAAEPASRMVAVGFPYGELAVTSREGYLFSGWFTAAEDGERVTAATIVTATEAHTLYAQWEEIIAGDTVYLETFTLPSGQSNLATDFGAPGRPNWIWTHGNTATVPGSYLQTGGPMIGDVGSQGGVLVITGQNNNWDNQPYFLFDANPALDLSLGAIEPDNIRQFRFVATKGTHAGFVAEVRAALRFGSQWYVSEKQVITSTNTDAFEAFTLNIQGLEWYALTFVSGETFSISGSGGTLAALEAAGQLTGIGLVATTENHATSSTQWRVDDVEISATPSTTTPRIHASPEAQFAPWGDSATFGVVADGDGVLSYQWYKDGEAIAGATNATLHFAAITQEDAGNYHVVVSMSTGSITSPTVPLDVVSVALSDRVVLHPVSGTPMWIHDKRATGGPDPLEAAMGYDLAPETTPLPGLFVPDGPGFRFRYSRREPAGRVRPQVLLSTDLATWYPQGTLHENTVGEPDGSRQEVEIVVDDGTHPHLFARLALIDERKLDELSFEATRDLWLRMMHYYSGVLNANKNRGVSDGFSNDMELVARTLWTLGAWFYHDGRPATMEIDGQTVDLQSLVVDALRYGTDSVSSGFWPGGSTGKSQPIVEAANIAFVAWALGDAYDRGANPAPWSQFSSTDRANIQAWLDSNDNNVTGTQHYFDNNWNMFIALNYEARRQLYAMGNTEFDTWVEPAIDEALRLIQTFNLGGGWFTDDNQSRPEYDDYGPWTIVSHQLFYFMMNPQRVIDNTPIAGSGGITPQQILQQISDFLGSQAYFYDAGGAHPEWGRSTTYKFGRLISNILAYVLDRQFNTPEGWNLSFTIMPEEMSAGQLKRMVRLHLNHSLAEEMIDPETFRIHPRQTRTSGPEVIESYSIPGSTYWAMITFAGLWLLEDDDPFWSIPEDPLPAEQGDFAHWFKTPGLLMHNYRDSGHLEAINLGNSKQNRLSGNYDRKYEKFVYSSRIGFVTRSGPAFDQAIEVAGETRAAAPRADVFFYEGMHPSELGVGRSVYQIEGRTVSTLVFLKDGAMVRVHRMSGAAATVREGGYALGHNDADLDLLYDAGGTNWQYYESPHGSAFTQLLMGYADLYEATNTGHHHTRQQNFRLFYGETVDAADGTVFAILSRGSRGTQDYNFWKDFVKDITIDGDQVTIEFYDDSTMTAPFKAWE